MNDSAGKAGTERGREKGVSEDRFQAKQTNSLRARGPRGLEFRCGPANWRNKSQKQEPPCKARCVKIRVEARRIQDLNLAPPAELVTSKKTSGSALGASGVSGDR